jgi:hypothetical protein
MVDDISLGNQILGNLAYFSMVISFSNQMVYLKEKKKRKKKKKKITITNKSYLRTPFGMVLIIAVRHLM